MTFVVICYNREDADDMSVYGPYRSFKAAEGDAKAWDRWARPTFVYPINDPETFWSENQPKEHEG